MAPPVKAEYQALRDDAAMWDDMSGTMSDAASAAEGLHLSSVQLSWVATETGLVETYSQIRTKVAGLLEGGAQNFEDISTTLTKVADVYEGVDTENEAQVTASWQPKN